MDLLIKEKVDINNKKKKLKGDNIMKKSDKNKKIQVKIDRPNECPEKDQDGNCLVPGAYSDSDPIGGG